MGVPLSPLPEVRSQREPIRSVRRRGVVPSETIFPTRLPSFFWISLDGIAQCLTGELCKVVVGQVFELQLVGRTLKAGGVSGGDDRIGQLPDLADGIFEGAVTIDHNLNMFPGFLQQILLDGIDERLAVAGEKLDLVLGGLIGAEQTVILIVPAAIDGGGQDLIHSVNAFGAGGQKKPLGTGAGVDVAVDDVFGVLQNLTRVIGKNHFDFGAGLADQIGIELHVIHAGETVLLKAEQLAILRQIQNIAVGINPVGVQIVQIDQMVPHFVRGIGEHEDDFLGAFRKPAQADGKAVAAEDRENHADGLSAKLGADICGDIVNTGIIALRTGDDSLRHADNVTITDSKAFALGGLKDTIDNDRSQVISLTDDGSADASGYSSNHAAHKAAPLSIDLTQTLYYKNADL